jgi:Cellulose biosynthesis protein BcsS
MALYLKTASALAALVATSLISVAPVAAQDASPVAGTVIFNSSEYKSDTSDAYLGLVRALNGNLASDGILLRVMGTYGTYEYDTIGGTAIDTDRFGGEIGLGYQVYSGGMRFAAYAMADYQNHDREGVDPLSVVVDDEWGFKGQLEAETATGGPLYVGLSGNYSTAFDSYWSRARVGWNLGSAGWNLTIGPEVMGIGNEDFDQVRYGAFVSGLPTLFSLIFGGDSKMTISGGYAESSGTGQGGEDSIYGTISSSYKF